MLVIGYDGFVREMFSWEPLFIMFVKAHTNEYPILIKQKELSPTTYDFLLLIVISWREKEKKRKVNGWNPVGHHHIVSS